MTAPEWPILETWMLLLKSYFWVTLRSTPRIHFWVTSGVPKSFGVQSALAGKLHHNPRAETRIRNPIFVNLESTFFEGAGRDIS